MSGEPPAVATTSDTAIPRRGRDGGRARLVPISAMLALIWFGFNGSDTASWIVGVPSVLIAAWAATRYPGRRSLRFRLTGFVGYSVYFLRQSLLGGWDVARRVLTRDMPIEPGHVSYTTALPAGPARDLLLSTISLLPGTLSAGLDGDRIDVHALDATSDVEADLGRLERRVAGVFSTPEGGR